MRWSPFLSLLAVSSAFVQSAEARETGDVLGTVTDAEGLPVPGAVLVLSGVELAGERTTTASDDGTFRFTGLNPGEYEIAVTRNDALIARAVVRVALETTTYADIVTTLGGEISDEMVVVFQPVVDVTQSAFSTSLGEDTIQNLPVGRSYQDVVNTIPGVTGRIDTSGGGGGDGNPSVRGEGQYGNNYMLDGVSTRDPASKTFGVSVNFDAIEEIQVYTDGAPAEFGQFTGMFVNVATKDGGDEHHGSAAIFYSQHAWLDDQYPIFDPEEEKEVPTTKARFRSPVFNGTAGGPLIEEKLWYFTAADLGRDWYVPEGLDEDAAITTSSGRFLGKLTWFPSPIATLRYQFLADYGYSGSYDASQLVQPEATSDRKDLTLAQTFTAELEPNEQNRFELRAGFTNINIDVVPSSGDSAIPSRLDEQGVLHDNATEYDRNDRNRVGGALIYQLRLADLLGVHKIRTGAEYWYLIEKRDILNTGETTIEWIDQNGNPTGEQREVGTRYMSGDGYPCEQQDYADCGVREHWTNVGPLGNTVQTTTLFIQDDWQPFRGLTINAGARLDMEDGRNDEGERPITQDPAELNKAPGRRFEGELGPLVMPAPRLGFAWDPLRTGKTKVTGHYGQYYDLAGNNLWSWSNARSASGFVRYARNAGGDWVWSNTQDPEGSPLIYEEGMKPARMDKLNLGVERELFTDFSMGIRGILSRSTNVPEDVDTNLDDWYIMNSPIKERRYRAVELTVQKNFDSVWQLYGSYTLQESYGHTPGQFELAPGAASGSDGNNVGVYLDDVGERDIREQFYETDNGWILEGFKGLGRYSVTDPEFKDEAGWYGYLPYHSFHAIKLNGSYTAPWGSTLGLVYEFDSGHAWQKRTFVPFYGYDAFGQGRGSRFMPAVHYVDMRIAHTFDLRRTGSLEATLDVFNVPGFASAITYFENDAPGFGSTLYRQSPRSIRFGIKYRY